MKVRLSTNQLKNWEIIDRHTVTTTNNDTVTENKIYTLVWVVPCACTESNHKDCIIMWANNKPWLSLDPQQNLLNLPTDSSFYSLCSWESTQPQLKPIKRKNLINHFLKVKEYIVTKVLNRRKKTHTMCPSKCCLRLVFWITWVRRKSRMCEVNMSE